MSMTTLTRTSHSKYRRLAASATVAPTADDDRILLEVYRHNVIDAKTIFALLAPRSEDRIRRRLRALFDAKLLHRLSQLEQVYVPGGGSLPIAYTLAPSGARRLREVYGLKVKTDRYRGRDSSWSPAFIFHGLEQTRFIVSARQAVAGEETVEFLYPDEIYQRYAPEILERRSLPRHVTSAVQLHQYMGTEGTIPDGFFALRYTDRPEGKNRRSLFIEIDRGSETIDVGIDKQKKPKFWGSSSLLRKFLVYGYAWKQKTHVEDFGIPTFQVITVTTDRSRVGKMQEMFGKRLRPAPHGFDPRLFLFTDFATVAEHGGNILTVPFEDAAGRETRLL